MCLPEGSVGGDEVKHLVFGISDGGATSLNQSDANTVPEALQTHTEALFTRSQLQVGAAKHRTVASLAGKRIRINILSADYMKTIQVVWAKSLNMFNSFDIFLF